MDTQNDFMLLRETVNKAVAQYMEARKKIGWKDKGHLATILQLAKPFQTGYFTVAIAGKMSSGKSTFINSLVGEELLPTGHFQTTSAITWIISSRERFMKVTFADGSTKKILHNFAQELKGLVAVLPEFSSLPISHINTLIKGGNNITTILKKKAGIEEMTQTSSEDDLWRKYVAATPKNKIVDKVEIYLQLPAEYEGWRIVDTPGVGAIGGIQDATKKLLTAKEGEDNKNAVDAVILLHKGTDAVEDETVNQFANEVRKSMGNLAKGRLFFVLTHAGHGDFLIHKDEILIKAENQFGKRLYIPKERISYVDSLIHRFLTDAKKSKRDFSNPTSLQTSLDGWSETDWETLKSVVSHFYMQLMMSGKEVNNNTLFTELETVSRFNALRDLLYDFLNQEKEKAFSDLLTLIKDELEVYGLSLRKDINSVSNGKSEIERQIEAAKEEERRLNLALVKVQQKATPTAIEKCFKFADEELSQLSKLSSISEVRTRYLEIIETGKDEEQKFFKTLISEFKSFIGNFSIDSVTFQSLDFSEIERQATDKATTQVTDYSRSEQKLIKKGGWSDDDEYETIYPYTKSKVDFDEKRRSFTALVVKEGRSHIKAYTNGMTTKVNEFFRLVSSNISEKTIATIERLKVYLADVSKKDAILFDLNNKLDIVNQCLKELKKLED